MKTKEQILTAIATILSEDYWKTSYAIANELRKQRYHITPEQVRIALRNQENIEMRKALGYRLRSQSFDVIDREILQAIDQDKNLGYIAERFKLSRQALNYRKQRLLKKAKSSQK